MAVNPIIKIIRTKKMGVLIRDARLKSGKSPAECAQAMGMTAEEFTAVEIGEQPLTLPELELFAYYLEIPLDHFWGSELLKQEENAKAVDPAEISKTRQARIGELIQQGRNEAKLTIEDLAQQTGIAVESLQAYENGERAIPLPELEIVAQELNNSIAYFEDQAGPTGSWFTGQKYLKEFNNLPKSLQEFISKPINRPYLELAVRLSELKVEKLRALGEGLLEITL